MNGTVPGAVAPGSASVASNVSDMWNSVAKSVASNCSGIGMVDAHMDDIKNMNAQANLFLNKSSGDLSLGDQSIDFSPYTQQGIRDMMDAQNTANFEAQARLALANGGGKKQCVLTTDGLFNEEISRQNALVVAKPSWIVTNPRNQSYQNALPDCAPSSVPTTSLGAALLVPSTSLSSNYNC